MPDRRVRVLLVDDDEDDFALTRYLLAEIKGDNFELQWEPNYVKALDAISLRQHDVYLLDYRLGANSGVALMRDAQARGLKGPFLLLTGQGQRELDVEAMFAGAADYLEKGQLTAALLERSIRYAIERHRHAEELERRVAERTEELARANARLRQEAAERERSADRLRLSEERFRLSAEAVNGIIYDSDLATGKVERTRGLREVIGYEPDEVPSAMSWWQKQIHPEDVAPSHELFMRALSRGDDRYVTEYRVRHRDGRWLHVVDRGFIVRDAAGQPARLVGCAQDVSSLRATEEALRLSRERLDLVVSGTELGLWYCDLPFDKLVWNDKCKEHFGLPPWAEVTIETFFERLHSDDRERTRESIGRSIEHDVSYDIAFRTAIDSGGWRWVRAIGRSFRDAAGKAVRFDGVTVDVTAQKRVEADLAESRGFLRSVLDTLPSHIAVIDPDGCIVSVNDAWRRFAQANALAMDHYGVGANYLDACETTQGPCEPNGLESVGYCIREVIAGKRADLRTEYPCHSPDEPRWFQMRVTRFPGDGPKRVVVAHEDITPRVLGELAVRRRSEQLHDLALLSTKLNIAEDVTRMFAQLAEAARELIGAHQAVINQVPDGDWSRVVTVASLSDKYAEYRGYDGQPAGGGIHAIVCEDNHPVRLTHEELLAHPAYKHLGREAGRHPPLRGWLAAPLVGRGGKNLGLIQLSDKYEGDFTADDEAMLVQMAQMASAALGNARLFHDLREADRRKTEFLAMLAHELRNPLAPIRNALYFARMHQRDEQTEALRESYSTMDRQIEHLIRLVDDLLDVSRITRGMIPLQKEPLDLAVVVARAVETARPLIDARGHRLEVSLPPGQLPMEADPVRLAQVVLNLLTNAARYTPRGGRVWLTVEREAGAPPWATIRVRDSGIGIPREMLTRVFDLFTQVDRTIERAEGGLGIGLTLVKRLAEMHGGRVEARSEGQGKGSEFVVRLPLSERPLALRPAAPPREAGQAARRRVLVIDDNRDSANSLAKLLGVMGHEVRTANDGRQGLLEVTAFRPEVVVLDLGMPGMTGFEVARHMRAMTDIRQPLLVALTGFGTAEDRRQTREAGFDAHLVKPVDLKALLDLLTHAG